MLELILCINKKFGLGFEGSIPWKVKDDLNLFRTLTMDSTIIVGRKTYASMLRVNSESLISSNRRFIVVSKSLLPMSLEEAIKDATTYKKKIFVAGGAEIYKQILENYRHLVSRIHVSLLNDTFTDTPCDVFIPEDFLSGFISEHNQNFRDFQYTIYKNNFIQDEFQYLELLKEVYEEGKKICGRNGNVQRLFSKNLKFDLRKGFPLLTTKKMFFRGIFEELIFFLKGETNTKILEEKGVNIWKGNTNREFLDRHGFTEYDEGEMGPMYGYQWRHFGKPFTYGISKDFIDRHIYRGLDQLEKVVQEIQSEPYSRRLLMTDYNPSQADQGVLYPCHSIVLQFFVEDGFLDVFCFNRSSDLFLGLPFNIASSSLLLIIIASLTGLQPRFLNLSLGDCHIYESHLPKVLEQINRIPYKTPTIAVKRRVEKVEDFMYDDFELKDYFCHPVIKAEMIA